MPEKVKCKHCGKEVQKINLKDHEDECYKNPNFNPNLKGLGGMLVLVQIGLIGSILFSLILSFDGLIIEEFAYSKLFGVLCILLFFYLGYTLFLMYKKDRRFPTFAIWSLWLSFVLNILDIFFFLFYRGGSLSSLSIWKQLTGGLMMAIICTLYFKNSARVKNTFFN